ncbi:hypothetical protein PFISCL1PPCAC_8201, partial [Pristionchus fissidentatus]
MECDISVLLEDIEVESLAFLLRHRIHSERLAGHEALSAQPALVGNRVVLSAPVDLGDGDVAVDGEVRDLRERQTVLELLQLLLQIRVALSLLLAPLALGEGVEHDLNLVVSHTHVEGHVVAAEVRSRMVEVDGESEG